MIPCLRCKPGAEFATISPAGFRILWALQVTAMFCGHDIWLTAGTNGQHSGPDDPHYHGSAYDVHCIGVPDKQLMLDTLIANLGIVKFYAFIEDAGTTNEHIHVQLRHGIMYP